MTAFGCVAEELADLLAALEEHQDGDAADW